MTESRAMGRGQRLAPPLFADSELVAALQSAVQEVFATMVFTACDRAPFDESRLDPKRHVQGLHVDVGTGEYEYALFELDAEVGFTGQLDGRVVLRCSAQGAMDIARGLLMLDEQDAIDLAEAEDALGECANMVTGVVKTRMLDPRGEFELSCPKINCPPALDGKSRAGTLAYKLRQGVIAVEIWLDEER